MMLSLVGIPLAIWLTFMFATLWLAARYGGRKFVWGLSILGVLVLLLLVFEIQVMCFAEPEFIAPTPEEELLGSIGTMTGGCDGPFGVFAFSFRSFVVPLALVGQGLLTWWMLSKAEAP